MEWALSSQALIRQRASHRSCSPTCDASHTTSTHRRSPTGCENLFFQGCLCFFGHFTWNSHVSPSRTSTSLWSFCIVEGKGWGAAGGMGVSANCILEAKYPWEFTRKEEYGGTPLLQKVKNVNIFLQWHNYSHPRMWERQCLQAEGKSSADITGNRTDKPFSQQKSSSFFWSKAGILKFGFPTAASLQDGTNWTTLKKLQLPLQPEVTCTQAVVTL